MWGGDSDNERQREREEEQRRLLKEDVYNMVDMLKSKAKEAARDGDEDRVADIERAIDYQLSRLY